MRFIAELCQNHNGDLKLLEQMIREASQFADIVKIQTILADTLTYREEYEDFRPYERESLRLQKLELSEEDEQFFIEKCKEYGVEPMTTLFSKNQIDRFNRLGYKKLKISGYSMHKFDHGLALKDINFEELFFSTSSMTLEEIGLTIKNLKDLNIKFTMLQCTCIYPTPLDKLNLFNIPFYKSYFNLEQVGFSDHTNPYDDSLIPTKQAIFMGADVLERHFTSLDSHKTRDGKVSITDVMGLMLKEFSELSKEHQYKELNPFTKEQKFNHAFYRGRFK